MLSSCLLAVSVATHLFWRFLHASSKFTLHSWSSQGVQNRSSASLSHLLLLLFPTAGAPCRWALVLSRGEHHHSSLTPKQPMQLSSLREGRVSSNSKPWPQELLLRARLGNPNLKPPFHQLFFKPGFPYYYYYYYPSAIFFLQGIFSLTVFVQTNCSFHLATARGT